MLSLIKKWLEHPLTRGLDIDDPRTTSLRLEIIRSKPFLRKLYEEWYRTIASLFAPEERVLEIGSGAGFLKEFMPGLITSELFPVPGVERIIDAQKIDFDDASLDGIVMTSVFHHIPDCEHFFEEAARVLRPGGRVVMIEPWNNIWAGLIYRNLHHEPFDPDAKEWKFPATGPLSSANGALPWIVFERDRVIFEQHYPFLSTIEVKSMMPLSYILSGGVSMRQIIPGWAFSILRLFERILGDQYLGTYALIILRKV